MTTLETVAIDLIMSGADRGALVRAETAEHGHGVCVLSLDPNATVPLFAALYPILMELGDEPVITAEGKFHDGRPDEQATPQTSFKRMFEHCDESPRHWLAFMVRIGTLEVNGLLFTGSICRRVAEICNAHRCPCSLDPNKPAPGYEIERVVNRRSAL